MRVIEADQSLIVEARAEVYLKAVELVEVENVLICTDVALLSDYVYELCVLNNFKVFSCELLVDVELVA
jgi:hypothetical protein